MKKNQHPSPLPYKTVFACLSTLLLLVLLASCEMQSIVGNWRNDGADTVYHSLEVTTTLQATTTEPPVTDPPVTEAPPPVTTAPPPVTEPPEETAYLPLIGLPCSPSVAALRPLSFCTRSAAGAVIAAADLVIEAPTEASSTRLLLMKSGGLSLFEDCEIASIRPYMAALSHDFFGLSVYRGTSDIGRESASFLYETVDLSLVSVKEEAAALDAAIQEAGHQTVISGTIALPYTLCDIGKTTTPTEATSTYVSIPYNSTAATAFTYDPLAKSYTMRSGPALREGSTALPAFKNLLILFFDSTRRVGRDGVELTLDTELGGTGYYVTEGGVVSVFWRRDPVTSGLCITDTDGVAITVNRGKTYLGMTTYEHRDRLILN